MNMSMYSSMDIAMDLGHGYAAWTRTSRMDMVMEIFHMNAIWHNSQTLFGDGGKLKLCPLFCYLSLLRDSRNDFKCLMHLNTSESCLLIADITVFLLHIKFIGRLNKFFSRTLDVVLRSEMNDGYQHCFRYHL
jgi:hypothetical protein